MIKNYTLHPLITASSFLFAALASIWGAYILAQPSMELLRDGIRTKATVVEVVEVHRTDFDGFSPVVVFIDSRGDKQEIQCRIATGNPTWKVGDELDVVYPENHPEEVQTTHWMDLWGAALIPLIASLVFLLMFFSVLSRWAWRSLSPAKKTKST